MDLFEIVISILVIAVNVIYYSNKWVLEKNGFNPKWIWSMPFEDISNMFRLAKRTQEPTNKRKYYTRALLNPALGILGFIIFITSFQDYFKRTDIDKRKDYLKQRFYTGKVIDKYIDESNHLNETIVIQNDEDELEIQDWMWFEKGTYETIKVGDSLDKVYGELEVTLFKQNGNISKFKLKY